MLLRPTVACVPEFYGWQLAAALALLTLIGLVGVSLLRDWWRDHHGR